MVLTAAAGRRSPLDGAGRKAAEKLLVVADVNAVPPAGIEGLDVNAKASDG